MDSDRVLYFEDGEVIFEEDSLGNEIYIIESGKVEISIRISGKRTPLAVLEQGELFGEMAAITDVPRTATATAIGDTKVIVLSAEELFQRIQSNPQFTANLLLTLINRLRSTTSTLRALIEKQ